jgi:RNA polymerase sigma factor for flagellar operon FliA
MAAVGATFASHEPRETSSSEITATIDDARRQRFVLEHLPQVQNIARRIYDRLPSHVLLEDLVHAGILGLLDAMHKYDPRKNVPLRHYAEFRIRGAILDSLRQVDWSPRSLRRQARRLEQAVLSCRARLGRDPTDSELAAALEMNLASLQQIVNEIHGLHVASLESLANESGMGEDAPLRGVSAEDEDPYQSTLRSERLQLLAKAVEEMPQRERLVLELYHFKGLTMKKIGAFLGIGESRVSQIHTAAIPRLRARLREMLRPRCNGQHFPAGMSFAPPDL